MLISMMAVFGAQAQAWQVELTKADGLPGKNMGVYSTMTTPVYTLDEAISTIRITVFSTENVDRNFPSGMTNNSSAFPTFAISEMRLFDGEGNKVQLTSDMFSTNAQSLDEGSLEALVDGDLKTHFHSTYTKGEVPQAYHYIDITLPQAMSQFKLEYDSRYYYFYTTPTHIALTAGTEANPYFEEEFVLGEQVTSVDALETNKLYVVRGNYFEFTRTDDERTLPSYGEAFYHSPHGAALVPSSASLMWLEDAGQGKYFMHWLKNDRYIKAGGEIEAGAYVESTANPLEAAALEFAACDTVNGAFIITSENNYLGQRRFVKMSWVNKNNMGGETSTYNYAWNIYEASTNYKSTASILQATIDQAKEFMAIQGVASEDNGEYAELAAAVTEAEGILAAGEQDGNEVLATQATLTSLINAYRITYIYVLTDSITNILENDDIVFCDEAWVEGGYPAAFETTLQNAMDEGGVVADNPTSSAAVEAVIASMTQTISDFYASVVSEVATFPIRVEDDKLGYTKTTPVNNSYIYKSPLYYLAEETDVLRMTVFKNSSGQTLSGTPFFCLGEFEIFDAGGNKLEITADMISTNSLYVGDGDGIPAIVDGDASTYYHGCYATAEGNIWPEEGKYHYVEFELPEAVSAFSFRMVSRSNSSDVYKHTPLDFAFTAGTEISFADLNVDLYPATRGEQITDVAQIVPGDIYVLYGNLEVVNNGSEGSGYYDGAWQNKGRDYFTSDLLITFEDAGEGQYYMRNLSTNAYLKTPAGWEGASVTSITAEACPLNIMASTNLENSFKIYYQGVITDPTETAAGGYGSEAIFVMQAWSGNIGMFTIANWESDDTDGESDWYIYKASAQQVEKLNLAGKIASVESYGIDYDNVGEAVGMLDKAAVDPVANALANAKAAFDADDAAAWTAAADELSACIQTIPSIKTNELISGQDYIIRSANKEFKPYHNGKNLSMFVGPSDGSGTFESDNMLWFTYEYGIDGLDNSVFHFTFTQDTVVNEGEETWGKYTIKNVLLDEYIVPVISYGKNISTQKFASNDGAPLIYLRPMAVGEFSLTGVEAWHQEDWPTYSAFETRTGGGGYATGGQAHYGHIATWGYSTATAQWNIVPVSTNTSISDIVVDEPAGEVVSTTYITPDGVTSNVPVKGVCIIRRVYANGVVETKKEFVK